MPSRKKPDIPEPSAMYKLHCEGAFGTMAVQLDNLRKATVANGERISELKGIVTNGLSHRVDAIDKRLWAIAAFTITELVGIVVILVTK